MGHLYHTARTVYEVSPLCLVGVRVQEVEFVLRIYDIVPHAAADGDDDDEGVDNDHDAGGNNNDDTAGGNDDHDTAGGNDDHAGGVDDDDDNDDDAGGNDDDDDTAGGNDDHDTAGGDGYDEMVLMVLMQVAMVLS